ncbi:MAG: hypothetical protein V1668_01600 [Patescibacteria group bacterium]
MERALGKITDKLDVGVVEAQAKQRIAERRARMTVAVQPSETKE